MLLFRVEDFDFDNILIDRKSYKNILVYDISFKNLLGSKPLFSTFDEVNGFIRVIDGVGYLVLLGSVNRDAIYNGIRYLISQKSGAISVFSHNYAKIKVDFYDSLPLEKILTFCNVLTLINSVLNKDKSRYYY